MEFNGFSSVYWQFKHVLAFSVIKLSSMLTNNQHRYRAHGVYL